VFELNASQDMVDLGGHTGNVIKQLRIAIIGGIPTAYRFANNSMVTRINCSHV